MLSRCLNDDFSATFTPDSALGGKSVNASRSATSTRSMICVVLLVTSDGSKTMFTRSSGSVELSKSIQPASDVEDGDSDLMSSLRWT